MADPAFPRDEPPYDAPERAMLIGWLEFHRATLAWKCGGLDDAQLRRRSVMPSALSLLGLIRHMADVERGWFANAWGGEGLPYRYSRPDEPDGDFFEVDDADVEEAFDAWGVECAHSRRLLDEVRDLDALGQGVRDGQHVSMRWILTHMIEEYARHNGHADLIRESIDGAVGE